MDFGEAKFIQTRFFNQQLLIMESVRHVGKVYKFHKKTDKVYLCASCRRLGKNRGITLVNGRIVVNKHPEDDHHPECQPVDKESVDVLEIDRNMRSQVNSELN